MKCSTRTKIDNLEHNKFIEIIINMRINKPLNLKVCVCVCVLGFMLCEMGYSINNSGTIG